MQKTTRSRLARIVFAAGLVATSLVPASGAMALTPPHNDLLDIVDVPQPPKPPTLPCLVAHCPITNPDRPTDPGPKNPGNDPETPDNDPETPDNDPETPNNDPGSDPDGPGDHSEVGDTVVSRPTFTG